MNIVKGKILERDQSRLALDCLEQMILETLSGERLDHRLVVHACDTLSERLNEKEHLPLLLNLGINEGKARTQLAEVKAMLSGEYLQAKLRRELGAEFHHKKQYVPLDRNELVEEQVLPLGVLLHIAAGNAQGLPVFSVVEGLLTGNINILKLPGVDDGISSRLLIELIKIESALSEYVYVFDYPSAESELIKKMAAVADAVVVWGSDAAVRAVRQLAREDTKIVEWGHKISFAYVTESGMTDEKLAQLADNICDTDQLLCNSCQGIFVDTDDMAVVYRFCERFQEVLHRVSKAHPQSLDEGVRAQVTLQLRREKIDALYREKRIFQRDRCSLIAYTDSDLEPSIAYRNCWVKRLPRGEILKRLKGYKNHLQTVGLLCADSERPGLAEIFGKTGITRVARGDRMSKGYCGAPHDGEYSLRRYTKVVSCE